MWEKKGLDELDCHLPLVVAAPWIAAASNGTVTSALVELVDVMPTAIELAGLPACADPCTDYGGSPSTPSGLQGGSVGWVH